jgi:hypothetical protein
LPVTEQKEVRREKHRQELSRESDQIGALSNCKNPFNARKHKDQAHQDARNDHTHLHRISFSF